MKDVLGRNLIVELFGCAPEILNDVGGIEEKMVAAARAARATVISVSFHHFAPFGVSGVVVIQESHLAIHTWPEYGYAALDIFTCGQAMDPWDVYREVARELQVARSSAVEVGRGERDLLVQHPLPGHGLRGPAPTPSFARNVWFTEQQSAIAVSLRHTGQPLLRERSAHQLIEIFETTAYGRALVLDGVVVAAEADEFIYHEMIVHPALLTHPAPRRALVIGGGDGGITRELLRHPDLDPIVVVEHDAALVSACRTFLPSLSGSLLDPRVRLQIGDGTASLRGCEEGSQDVIILDITASAPSDPAPHFDDLFRAARRALRPHGALIVPGGSPHSEGQTLRALYQSFTRSFGRAQVSPYLVAVPTYPSGLFCLLLGTREGAHPVRDLDLDRAERFRTEQGLRCYSAAVHSAAFVLPEYVQSLLQGAGT